MSPAVECFNNILNRLHNPAEEIFEIKSYIEKVVMETYEEFEYEIKECTYSTTKTKDKGTNVSYTLNFDERRVVFAYNFLRDPGKYINIVLIVMNENSGRNLSIRKSIFLYDTEEQELYRIENEIPEI